MVKNTFGNKGLKRNRFDDALSARIKVSPRNNSLGDPLNTGVNIAQQDLNNAVNIRNEHDDDAELFTNLSKIAGDKPEGAAALFTGLMEGAAYGAKTKSTAKKQEALDKYDRVTDYFRQVNAQAMEMKEWHQKRDFAQQKYMPQVLAYAENIDKLDTQSQRLMAQGILDGWNRTTGDNYKLNTIDGADPFVMTVSSEDGTQVIDVRDLFAGDEVLQQRLAMKTPEYQMKLQEERQQKAFDNQIKKDDLELKKYDKGLDSKFGRKNSGQGIENLEYNGHKYDVVSLSGREKGEITDYGKTVNKAVSQIPTNENAIKAIHGMREIFERNPNIGESWVNMLSSGDDEDSWRRYIAKNFASRKERADMEILKKLSSDLNLSTVLSIPGKSATDILKRAIQASSPTGTLTKKAFDKVSNDWEERAIEQIDSAKVMAHARAQGKMIVSKAVTNNQPQGSNPSSSNNSTTGESRVPIFDPETKKQLGTISENEVDQAVADGFLVGEVS